MSENHQFIATEASYFSGKLRAYLRYQEIPYTEIDSSMKVMKNIVSPRIGKMMIPILITPEDECLQDTTVIIDHFEARNPKKSVYPETPKQKLAALLLECFGDEWLGIYALHYRWDYGGEQRKFTAKNFGQTSLPGGNKVTQYLAYKFVSLFITQTLKKAVGAHKAIAPAIRKSYETLVDALDIHFANYPYLLGNRPSIADYSFVGLFYGHQYRDPFPSKHLHETAPNVIKWIRRVQFLEDARYGDFLPNDEIPDTLIPILKCMTREQFPELEATVEVLDRWIENNPKAVEVDRFLGKHEYSIGGATGQRQYISFSCWMLQRCTDYYNSVEDKAQLDAFLASIDGNSLFDKQGKNRLVFKDYTFLVEGRSENG